MTEIDQDSNLLALTKEFMGASSRRAERLARNVLNGRDKETDLDRLLRHHHEKSITNEETWLRDDFDYLLSFYSILEIAALLGLITIKETPFFERIRQILEFRPIRRYYERHYRLLLPQLFLRRLTGSGIPNENLNDQTIALFYEFLPLVKIIEEDKDVEVFLWFMDGGEREGFDYEDTIRSFKEVKVFAQCLCSVRKKTPLDASVQGFAKFIRFCIDFDYLLNSARNHPKFQAEAFFFHSYWFMQCSKKLGRKLERGIHTIDDTGGNLREEALPALKRLLSGEYGEYLAEFAGHGWGFQFDAR
jgi:hypothetical protein